MHVSWFAGISALVTLAFIACNSQLVCGKHKLSPERQLMDGMARACDVKGSPEIPDNPDEAVQANHVRETSAGYNVLKALGEGSYASVYLICQRGPSLDAEVHHAKKLNQATKDTRRAIKLVNKASVKEAINEYIRAEAKIHMSLMHPFIVAMHGTHESEDHFALLMEYAPGGDLHDMLTSCPNFVLDLTRTRRYLRNWYAYNTFMRVILKRVCLSCIVT